MRCPFKHQRAYATPGIEFTHRFWCPDCKTRLSRDESKNVELRLMRKAAGVSTSDEQHILEKEKQ